MNVKNPARIALWELEESTWILGTVKSLWKGFPYESDFTVPRSIVETVLKLEFVGKYFSRIQRERKQHTWMRSRNMQRCIFSVWWHYIAGKGAAAKYIVQKCDIPFDVYLSQTNMNPLFFIYIKTFNAKATTLLPALVIRLAIMPAWLISFALHDKPQV